MLENKKLKKTEYYPFSYGNRCGHQPDAPILRPQRQPPENLPKILQDAIERCSMFYRDPNRFPELVLNRYSPRQRHHVHKITDFTSRTMRSERRESVSRVMALLLSMVDLRTLRVGYTNWSDPGFVIPDTYWMAEKCGLGYDRLCRALRTLRDAGYIRTTERAEIIADDGITTTFRARTAVRTVTIKFFIALGIDPGRVKRERDAAYDRYIRRIQRHNSQTGVFNQLYQTLTGKRRRAKIIERRGEVQPTISRLDKDEINRRAHRIMLDHLAEFSKMDVEQRRRRAREMAIAELIGRRSK